MYIILVIVIYCLLLFLLNHMHVALFFFVHGGTFVDFDKVWDLVERRGE